MSRSGASGMVQGLADNRVVRVVEWALIWLMAQERSARDLTMTSSVMPTGLYSVRKFSRWLAKASISWSAMTTVWPEKPCCGLLRRTAFRPAMLVGPVDFWAFSRFARSWASEMGIFSFISFGSEVYCA